VFILEACMIFSVSCTCGVIFSQNCNWNLLSVMASVAMKASLKVCSALFIAFILWLCGSTSCNLHHCSVRKALMCVVPWLPTMFILDLNPFKVRPLNCFCMR
jgi:hypothetical protein